MSIIASCSSSTTDGSAWSAGANDHDLANYSTGACLAEVSAEKKSLAEAWAGPSVPLPFDEGAVALKGMGADAAAASRPSSVCGRLRELTWGRFNDTTRGLLLRGANDGACKKKKSVNDFHSGKAIEIEDRRIDFLCLHLYAPVPLFLMKPLGISSDMLYSCLIGLKSSGNSEPSSSQLWSAPQKDSRPASRHSNWEDLPNPFLSERKETIMKPIVETIPPKVPVPAGSPLDRMDQPKRATCAS
ncbi:LOW QUALITY PROTEIN: hypothetical protein Cgig2_014192 [Carnegiea gigantea]|uniref:Uncharacterized protein n=1 Tax=Carnegiea gigantea TaxID=171969 RepID=A0A9Q1JY73_9CARY|nr:LOW QUALITY PROTEIN: hypothetical protein Cgig2_014192 [Carnegiea gigantea]